jgi:hypothetical protein
MLTPARCCTELPEIDLTDLSRKTPAPGATQASAQAWRRCRRQAQALQHPVGRHHQLHQLVQSIGFREDGEIRNRSRQVWRRSTIER